MNIYKIGLVLFIGTVILMQGCKKEPPKDPLSPLDQELIRLIEISSNGEGASWYALPASDDFANIPQDPKNPLNAAKVELGKLLFHEPGLAIFPQAPFGSKAYSCATCHHAGAGFQAGRKQGIGEGGTGFGLNGEGRINDPIYPTAFLDVQPIRSPSTINSAYQINQLWDGSLGATGLNVGTESLWLNETPKEINFLGFEGLETQAIAGMAIHRQGVDTTLLNQTKYKMLFDEAFASLPEEERISFENIGLAMAAYERTSLANQAPFQDWIKEDYDALTDQQKEGAILFFGKANCFSCHNNPALNSMEFHALGLNDLNGQGVYGSEPPTGAKNRGRGGFTNLVEDFYKFKVPQLYNLKDSPFLGHGGNINSVKAMIEYKNNAIAQNSNVPIEQLASEFIPLNLTTTEIEALTDFIENGLHDPNLARYSPSELPSGLCFPNNDTQSKVDLGCE